MPKIGYVTMRGLANPRQWPKNEVGHMGNALRLANELRRQRFSIVQFSPLAMPGRLAHLTGKLRRILSGDRPLLQARPGLLRKQARQIQQMLAQTPVDLLLGNNTRPFAALDTDLPIVVWRDATFAGALKAHRDFQAVRKADVELGHKMEQAALSRCALAVFRSKWAARDAVATYGLPHSRIRILPTGGNLLHTSPPDVVRAAIAQRTGQRLELLFVGVDWESKGGPVAADVCRHLQRSGIPCRLTLIGSAPPADTQLPDETNVIEYLDIRSHQGHRAYEALLLRSHFLLLPSRADTFGSALVEANAYGVPALASDIAGFPEVVRDGVNGRVFPIGGAQEARSYADYIAEVCAQPDQYQALANGAFDEYQARLSWDVVGPAFADLLQEVLRAHPRTRAINEPTAAIKSVWHLPKGPPMITGEHRST